MDMKAFHKEALQLGKDLTIAKIKVYKKHGFSVEEISRVMGTPESVIRIYLEKNQENIEESN